MIRCAAAGGTVLGARDAAILALVFGAGLREREILRIEKDDVDADGCTIRVRQNDGYARRVRLSPGAAAMLRLWLSVRGDDPGALFYSFRRKASTGWQRMSESAVAAVLRTRAAATGLRLSGASVAGAVPGQWSIRGRACHWITGFDLLPIDYPDPSLIPKPDRVPRRLPATCYLWRLDATSRRLAFESLRALLGALGEPDADVAEYPWTALSQARLRSALDSARLSSAMLTRARKSLAGILTYAYRQGEISMRHFDELTGWSWRSGETERA